MDALELIREAEKVIAERVREFEETAYFNQIKVLKAFQELRVREYHFHSSSGYGYGDIGRDDLEEIYRIIFKAEDAMVRSQIVSGTHAIAACLLGLLRPGDELISLLGSPYDTLGNVIGKFEPQKGSLIDRGVRYSEVDLDQNGHPDLDAIKSSISENTRMVLIQRSRGYSLRPSLCIKEIEKVVRTVRSVNSSTIIFVDNCYGEFTERTEPIEVGADLIAGSLIKNPGGGLAPAGGYIAGKKELVEEVACHITAPGLGKELGASLLDNRLLYQGLFLAPHVVLQALKGSCLLAYLFEQMGYSVYPRWNEHRGDIVEVFQMNSADEVIRLCQAIQNSSPVDSDVKLEYADLPGYTDQVVMAAGTFVQGASIEISCDAPLREPYCAYFQGGLSYEHCRYVAEQLIKEFR